MSRGESRRSIRPALHLAWLRCSSAEYCRYVPSSRLTIWHAGALYVFTKHRADTQSQVYRLEDRAGGEPQVLQPLGAIELGVEGLDPDLAHATAADVSADGRHVALLTSGAIHLFESAGATLWPLTPIRRIALNPRETQQAESIAWDGTSLLFGNEPRQLFHVPEPILVTAP